MINAANLACYHDSVPLRSYTSNTERRTGRNCLNRFAQARYIDLLESVQLLTPVDVGGRFLPKGSIGTVVYKYAGAYDYEVEFNHPFHSVAYIEGRQIIPVRDWQWSS